MLTGKQLSARRKKCNGNLSNLADACGTTITKIEAWEGSKYVVPKNAAEKKILSELLDQLGFSHEEKLLASLPQQPRQKKPNTPTPSGARAATQALQASTKGTIMSENVVELATMLGFFMSTHSRRSNLGRLLKAAIRCGITIHGIERAIDGNG